MASENPDNKPLGRQFTPMGLNDYVLTSREVLIEQLTESLSVADRNAAFIDESFELLYPNAIAFTDGLTELITRTPPDKAARLTSYRAFHLA